GEPVAEVAGGVGPVQGVEAALADRSEDGRGGVVGGRGDGSGGQLDRAECTPAAGTDGAVLEPRRALLDEQTGAEVEGLVLRERGGGTDHRARTVGGPPLRALHLPDREPLRAEQAAALGQGRPRAGGEEKGSRAVAHPAGDPLRAGEGEDRAGGGAPARGAGEARQAVALSAPALGAGGTAGAEIGEEAGEIGARGAVVVGDHGDDLGGRRPAREQGPRLAHPDRELRGAAT